MKRLLTLLSLLLPMYCFGAPLVCSNLVSIGPTAQPPPYNVGVVSNTIQPGSIMIMDTHAPTLEFIDLSYPIAPYPYGGGTLTWANGSFNFSGPVIAATTILWQTNVVWATNSFYSIYATNTPDGHPIPWKAGTNVWTGTNTYSGTVNLNGPVKVNGAGGGTSNVPMGGVTFHFVNGFYTGATTP